MNEMLFVVVSGRGGGMVSQLKLKYKKIFVLGRMLGDRGGRVINKINVNTETVCRGGTVNISLITRVLPPLNTRIQKEMMAELS